LSVIESGPAAIPFTIGIEPGLEIQPIGLLDRIFRQAHHPLGRLVTQ
jgi:hypothetical protein